MAGTDVVIRFLGDASGAVAAMKQVDRQSESMSRNMQKVGAAMSVAVTLPLLALGKAAFDQASNLNESMSKSAAIFGQNSRAIEQWASGAAKDFGQSKQMALENASSFGNMFNQLGIGLPVVSKMSKQMVELASDFASFHNADISQVLEAQSAAFRGEYDAVQKFVPTINAAAVQTKALAMTGKDNAAALTEQDKAMAAYRLMVEGAGKAMGDFDKTSGGAANQQRILKAQMADMQAELGQALLPTMTKLVGVVAGIAAAFTALPDGVQTATVAFLAFLAAVGPIMTLAGSLGSVVRGLKSVFSALPGIMSMASAAMHGFGEAIIAAAAPLAVIAAGVAVLAVVGVVMHKIFGEDMTADAKAAAAAGDQLGRSLVNQASGIRDLTAQHDQLSASLRDLKAVQVDSFNEYVKNINAQGQVKEALTANEAAQKAAAVAAREQATAIAQVAIGTTAWTAATNETRTAIEALNNVILGQSNAAIAYEQATINVARAEREAAAAVAVYGAGSEEARIAVLNLESAKNTEIAATMSLAKADADAANAINSKNVPALIASRDALIRTAEAHGGVTAAQQEQIDKMNRMIFTAGLVPPTKETLVVAQTEQAMRQLLGISTAADEAARTRTLTVNVLANTEALREWAPHFATGGLVPGPKGRPMVAVVHGGEYITPVSKTASMLAGTTAASSSSSGGGAPVFNIDVRVEAGVPPAEVGAAIIDKIRSYERVAGRSWRGA